MTDQLDEMSVIGWEGDGMKFRKITLRDWFELGKQMPGGPTCNIDKVLDWITQEIDGVKAVLEQIAIGDYDTDSFDDILEWTQIITRCAHLPKVKAGDKEDKDQSIGTGKSPCLAN